MFVKAQLHFHTNLDPHDRFLKYSPYEAIDEAYNYGFKIVSFTHHKELIFDNNLKKYAFEKGIILIPGVEYNIGNKHVLIYNADEELYKVKTFEDLIFYKSHRKRLFIIAPHPFYPFAFCLKKRNMHKYVDLFDAIEYSALYTGKFGKKANQKAQDFATVNNKPLVGSGDIHNLKFIDETYSLVNIDFDFENLEYSKFDYYVNNIFDNIRNNNIELVSSPISIRKIIINNLGMFKGIFKRTLVNFLRFRKKYKI